MEIRPTCYTKKTPKSNKQEERRELVPAYPPHALKEQK